MEHSSTLRASGPEELKSIEGISANIRLVYSMGQKHKGKNGLHSHRMLLGLPGFIPIKNSHIETLFFVRNKAFETFLVYQHLQFQFLIFLFIKFSI